MKSPRKSTASTRRRSPAEPQAPPDLELPVDPGFIPLHFPANANLALELSAAYLPRLLARPEFWAERAEQRCLVEFDLHHPERHPATYPAAAVNDLLRPAAPPRAHAAEQNTPPTGTGSHP